MSGKCGEKTMTRGIVKITETRESRHSIEVRLDNGVIATIALYSDRIYFTLNVVNLPACINNGEDSKANNSFSNPYIH